MLKQQSSGKGPDTIYIPSCGMTYHNSILIQEFEARLYANCTDMKIIIQRLFDDENVSNYHAERIKDFYKKFKKC